MKKIIILALLTMIMVGCNTSTESDAENCRDRYHIIILDSCEYLSNKYIYDLTHKGNCRFCIERNKRMIREQVDSILTDIFD